MRRIRSLSALALLFVLSSAVAVTHVSAQGHQAVVQVTGGITTLYAHDPLFNSLCMNDGGPGSVIQANEVRNRCSDINFNSYNANGFTVGIEGGRDGVILDIGNLVELQKKYGYSESVGNGQGFTSIVGKDGKLYIRKDQPSRSLQEIQGLESFFQTPIDNGTAQVKVGHVYLMRLKDRYDKEFERIAKLIVIAYVPGESVTFRWQVL